jgi:hypothetical protein
MCARAWVGHSLLVLLNGLSPLVSLPLHRRVEVDGIGLHAPRRITGDLVALTSTQLSSELTQI